MSSVRAFSRMFCIALFSFSSMLAMAADVDKKQEKASEPLNTVVLQTNLGEIEIELNPEKAPNTVENFKQYVAKGFYDKTIFHRVIKGFMIQGGGFDADLQIKATEAPIKNEASNGLPNVIGSIAMARTGEPHSATSQFFINVNNNTALNFSSESARGWGYAVFGQVVKGMDVVTQITQLKTKRNGPHGNVPIETVTIEKAYLR